MGKLVGKSVGTRRPNERLRLARLQRGWRQMDTVVALERLNRYLSDGDEVGADETTISRWERGVIVPGDFYKAQLCLVYKVRSPEELGWESTPALVNEIERLENRLSSVPAEATAAPDDTREDDTLNLHRPFDPSRRTALRRVLATAATAIVAPHVLADPGVWDRLRTPGGAPANIRSDLWRHTVELTRHFEHLRRTTAGRHLIASVRAHLDFVASCLRDSSLAPGEHLPMVSAFGEVAVLAGRLSFWDLHDETRARHYFEMAGAAAHESEDRALASYAIAFTAELETYVQQPRSGAEQGRAAQELAGGAVTPRVRSWLSGVEAEANANSGDSEACVSALARAHEAMAEVKDGDPDPQWIEFFDESRLLGYEGACLTRIGRSSQALTVLGQAADSTDPALKRYHAEIAADTAWSLAQ
ncbi:MAG TPA: helix-turn-helix transcriptional regulator, partial [Chloroflexota bacterium]